MVGEIGVHDDYVVAGCKLEAVDVGGAKTELASAGVEVDVGSIDLCELIGNDLGAVWRAVVDDDELPVEVPKCGC